MTDTKRRGRLIAGITGLVLTAWYLFMAADLPRGRLDAPGAGTFPLAAGAFLGVASILLIVESLTSDKIKGNIEFPRGRGLRLVAVFVVATTVLVLALTHLGQYLTSFLYVLVVAKALGAKGWVRPLLFAAIASGVVSWLFLDVFNVPLTAWPEL